MRLAWGKQRVLSGDPQLCTASQSMTGVQGFSGLQHSSRGVNLGSQALSV